MTETRFDLRLIDERVFTVAFVFSLIGGVNMMFSMFLPVLLARSIGTAAFGAVNLLWSSLYYIFSPVLYFIVLYLYCGGPLLNRIARVLISIVFGSLLGCWIGYLTGALVATAFSEQSINSAFSNLVLFLPQHVIGQLLTSFAILAFSDLVPRWRNALPIQEFQGRRPGGLVLLVAIYIIFTLLNILALPLLGIYAISNATTSIRTLEFIALISTLGLAVIGQLILAVGLYRGKKWAWILAVISSASNVLIEISTIGAIMLLGVKAFIGLTWMVLGVFLGFPISLAILSYLMTASMRQFFGFVNPIEQMQRAPAKDEFQQSSSSMS